MLVIGLAFLAVLGLAIGSFLNVVIGRVPAGESVLRPASRCPSCGASIRNRHNVPVVGWLALRGRCADCDTAISWRYPVVELGTAAAFVLVALRLHQLGLDSALPAYLYFVAAGIALTAIDFDCHRLPDVIVLPSYAVLAALFLVAAVVQHDGHALARAAIAAVALGGFYAVLWLAYPAGMGFGDVKLSGLVGAVLGYLSWSAFFVGAFAGFFFGAVVGVAAMSIGGANRKTALPFGPFMIGGALVALFIGDPLADAFLGLAGRS